MKASLKFRDDQNPIFRAKVPLNILGLPFQSGIIAGESKELSLNLSTFFESGPSIKISYRPNDTWNPFALVIKTGTGPFGSPVSSSMIMSAEFNLLSKGDNNLNPSFMLHFKPQFGDFSIKKSQLSSHVSHVTRSITKGVVSSDDDGSIEVVDATPPNPNPALANGVFNGKRITVLPPLTASAVAGIFSGVEVAANTRLPVRSMAVVNFRWGVRVPAEIKSGESTAGINFRKIPFLVMNKVGIEHVDGRDERSKKEGATGKVGMDLGDADVAEACLAVKRQLEVLQSENGHLKKAVEELREEIGGGKLLIGDSNSGKYERNGIKSPSSGNYKIDRRNNEKKSMEGDVNEELKKALKGATSGIGA